MGIRQIQPIDTEMKMDNLVSMFEKEEENRKDVVVRLNKIRMNKDFKFESPETGEFDLSEKGFKQLCQQAYQFAIPSDYMMKLWESDREQFLKVMNYHLENGKDTEKKLRGIYDDDGLSVRGIVSTSYTPFDNLKALEAFMDSMKKNGVENYTLKNTNIKEDFMFLRFVLNDTETNLGSSFEGKEDWNYVSLDLVNGETGNSSLRAISSVYRQICTNGMVSSSVVENLIQRHIGDITLKSMTDSIERGIENGSNMLQNLAKAKAITIENPYEVIGKHSKAVKLNDSQSKVVRENYDIEADKNLMSIVNAFTRTARDFKSIDKRLELEKVAHKILESELKKRA